MNIIKEKETFKVKFSSYTHDGLAIAKINGINKFNEELTNFPIFVENALIDEEAIIELDQIKRSFGKGHIKKLFIDKASKNRVMPKCLIYENCGGCHLQHMNYNAQLEFKTQRVIDAFTKIGGFTEVNVKQCLPSSEQYYYRNKVQIPFGFQNGKTVCGFYKRETHEIIPLISCYLQEELVSDIVKFIKNLCNELLIKGYNELELKGDIRHVLIKTAIHDSLKQIMVVIVTTRKEIKNFDILINKLKNKFSNITSIIQNINNHNSNVILGDENILLYGNDYIIDDLMGYNFKIGVHSFYQINARTVELLYSKAFQMANFNNNDIVIDAYSGIGTIGICLSKMVKQIYQVEVVEEAVKNALTNIEMNKIHNVICVHNDALKQIKIWKEQLHNIDAIIVDPPRKGLEIELMNTIYEMQIKKILYISCDVSTMARDIKYLNSLGYTFDEIQPIDMFPHTLHCECIVTLSLKH